MDFNGKVAIVSGGAGGIGKAISRALLDAGMKVCICDINESAAKIFLAELSNEFENNVFYVKCDVSIYDDYRAAFEKTKQAFGRIDVVMNNAGIMNEQEWKKVVDINIVGVIHGVHLAFEFMGKNHGGSGGKIINTASQAVLQPLLLCPIYTASKHSVIGLTRSYGQPFHFEKTGITVNAICPGPVLTQIYWHYPDSSVDKKAAEVDLEKYTPISPSEVGKAVVKLLQDGKNGALLCVDHKGVRYVE